MSDHMSVDLIVDMRSDTVTRPTPAMRESMATAAVGDDVFGDDPTINRLEGRVAELLDKEAALFVPSGTMANQLALRAQTRSGDEVLLHGRAHIFNYESGAAAALSGVTCRPISSDDGTLPLDALRANIHRGDDPHYAPTRLVCLENTHNACGGRVLPMDHVRSVIALAHEHDLLAHLDGARLWNAAVASGLSMGELTKGFDSVSLCFSKGLGAPVGSVLAGEAEFIGRAHRFRKMFGGGIRQGGIIAAGALHALDHHVDRLEEDHRRAAILADALAQIPGVELDLEAVQTNLVYFTLAEGHPLVHKPGGATAALREQGVGITGAGRNYRAVLHLDVDDEGLDEAIAIFRRVLLW